MKIKIEGDTGMKRKMKVTAISTFCRQQR